MRFTTMEEVSNWFDYGKHKSATHMIVVCDQFDHTDFPVFVTATENVREVEQKWQKTEGHRVMEVYNLSKDKKEQLSRHRCFEY